MPEIPVFDDLELRLRQLERDIAESKRINRKRAEEQSFFETLVNEAPVGIARISAKGRFLYINESLAKTFGYTYPKEFLANVSNIADLYLVPEKGRRDLNQLKRRNSPDELDAQVKGTDGRPIWLRIFFRPIVNPADEGVYEIFTVDITERRMAREALHESEKRFRMLVEQAGDSFFLHDQEGWILDVNRQACESLGYTRDELLTKHISEIALKLLKKEFWQPLSSGKYVTFESIQKRKDGSTFPVEVRLGRLDLGGQILLLALVRDITFRKDAENELKKNFQEIKELKNRLEQENVYLREEIDIRYRHEEIVGESRAIRNTLSKIEKVAGEESCVLILGETGTGKELVARAIHNMSSRGGRTMVKVNCAALPATLIESELFGREKGAFTGAMTKQIGRFEAADQSTIFLDEIGDMPLETQTRLLRVLQDGTFERLGSFQSIKVNVRVVAASNQDLTKLIRENRFRRDLYYRLNVFPIRVPSLRERLEDIPLLVWAFVKEFSETMGKRIKNIPKKDMDLLRSYTWPGNIRELRNVIERAMIMARSGILRIGQLDNENTRAPEMKNITLASMEKRYITDVLNSVGWRVSGSKGAAAILDINQSTLRSRMKKLGIRRPEPNL
jgi:formate hydrogenlyase transcriptional activator